MTQNEAAHTSLSSAIFVSLFGCRTYAWTLWEATVPVPKDRSQMDIVCKAVDSSYNTQPEHAKSIWNIRGVLSNSWHRVALKIADEDS